MKIDQRRVLLGAVARLIEPLAIQGQHRRRLAAGCYSADDAVRTLRLARELLGGHKLVKLEVLGDPKNAVSQRNRNYRRSQNAGKRRF